MDLDKLNKWLTLSANVGVLAGIMFLAVEIQQNTRATEAQTRDSLTAKQIDILSLIGSSEFTTESWRAGGQEDPEASLSYALLVTSMIRSWENEHYQYERGLFDEEEFEPRLERWKSNLERPGFQNVWMGTQDSYSPRFRTTMNHLVEEIAN